MSIPIDKITRYFITTRPSARSASTRSTPHQSRPHDIQTSERAAEKVRFICVSDTHSTSGWDSGIPDGDVLIHSGDLTRSGTAAQLAKVYSEIKALPHKIKLVIAGNHDLGLDPLFLAKHAKDMDDLGMGINETNIETIRAIWKSEEARSAGIIFLEHEATNITVRDRSFSVFGSPYSPEFFDWAFMYAEDHDIWSGTSIEDGVKWQAAESVDILITHGPPKDYLDEVNGHGHVGCPLLKNRLSVIRPLLHVFGHIHEGAAQGLQKARFGKGAPESILVNASLLDEKYRLVYRPTIIDL